MIDEPKIQAAIARCLSCIGEQDGIGVFASLELLEAA